MDFKNTLRTRWFSLKNQVRLNRVSKHVAAQETFPAGKQPVVVFNASTRIHNISQNAAFSLLTSWGLRLAGIPIIHYTCQAGMQHCVLGTNRQDYRQPPPCQACIAQSKRLFANAKTHWFTFQADEQLASITRNLNVSQLSTFEYSILLPGSSQPTQIPIGKLALPALRWALRRHTLPDDQETAYLMRAYIHSAYSIAKDFALFANQVRPAAALIFNGIMYPEATVRWVCDQRGIPVILHEVGFQPFSAFFTTGEATAYPIPIPESFELNPQQNTRLDLYLEQRFQGKFSMAGIQFWPEMHSLDQEFLEKASKFRQVVPIFTNVIYDTSQMHANQVFSNMFAWLDTLLEAIREHPETLFVIRAHPDEMRPDSAKQSNESVRDWVDHHGVRNLPNVVFIDSQEFISSYELIQRAKFVIVYNSSIGLEAALMGAAVLCGGKARYTQYPMVFFPETPTEYTKKLQDFLAIDSIQIPPEFIRNARRFLYYQLYRASLPFSDFLSTGSRKGFVGLKHFSWKDLLPENAPTIKLLANGVQHTIESYLDDLSVYPDSKQAFTFLLEESE
ncbi:MAG TPA: hypothetical protein VLM80_10320 [Anaerolineales bacterium]|nr:hypothetical protein [Anaerolineales bacterium]